MLVYNQEEEEESPLPFWVRFIPSLLSRKKKRKTVAGSRDVVVFFSVSDHTKYTHSKYVLDFWKNVRVGRGCSHGPGHGTREE